MSTSKKIPINIETNRREGETVWDLPPWGHPISLGVMPLFISIEDRLKPIGTAFTITDGVILAATAHHVIMAAAEHDRKLDELSRKEHIRAKHHLEDVSFYLLHHRFTGSGSEVQLNFWPIENYTGTPPGDAGLCSLKFAPGIPTLKPPISFVVPPQGERVRCIGYIDFKYPPGGIPLEQIENGTFNWNADYRHRLVVVEGFVKQTFSSEFSRSYNGGPCFAISNEIFPGQSGGPAFDSRGYVCGINSASATSFFDEPASLISLLYPLLATNVTFGASIGPDKFKSTQPFAELIGRGHTLTDGTEEWVHFTEENGEIRIGPLVPNERVGSTHETFYHFNEGIESGREDGPGWVFKFNRTEKDGTRTPD